MMQSQHSMGLSMASGAFVVPVNDIIQNNSSFRDFSIGGGGTNDDMSQRSPKQMHESVKPSDLMMSIINQQNHHPGDPHTNRKKGGAQQRDDFPPSLDSAGGIGKSGSDSQPGSRKLQHEIFFENENRAMKDLMKGLTTKATAVSPSTKQ